VRRRARRPAVHGLAAALVALIAAPAPVPAVLVDTSAPELYERPPADDPGWRNVGRRGSTSAIYLGDGWVLTARHSSLGPVTLDGRVYEPVAGSDHWISSPTGAIKADLLLFRIAPEPDLPDVAIVEELPRAGTPVVLVGYGQGRGGPALSGPGFRNDGRGVKRWGANEIEGMRRVIRGPNATRTQCFSTIFSADGPPHEAQATVGDSGGAIFVRARQRWLLAGVMLSVGGGTMQRSDETLFGNTTHAADLATYAPEILAVIEGRARTAR